MNFPSEVQAVIDQLKSEFGTLSVWFIGSRANGTYRSDSDWDFVCFRNSPVEIKEARCEFVDVVQVGNDGKYLLEGQPPHLIGQFKNWDWNQINSNCAKYRSRIVPQVQAGEAFDLSKINFSTFDAHRV